MCPSRRLCRARFQLYAHEASPEVKRNLAIGLLKLAGVVPTEESIAAKLAEMYPGTKSEN